MAHTERLMVIDALIILVSLVPKLSVLLFFARKKKAGQRAWERGYILVWFGSMPLQEADPFAIMFTGFVL